jgi:ribonuclease Z
MRPAFLARLINGPSSDPCVFVRPCHGKEAVLFDCGRIAGLSNREALALRCLFVSHAHMDHFMGFDHVLRTILHRRDPLHVYGPEGMTGRVLAKLAAYTWNLTARYPLEVVVHEVADGHVATCRAAAADGFAPGRAVLAGRTGVTVYSCPRYRVDAVVLDHDVPCLGFALSEPFHVNIRAGALQGRGYRTGEWIGVLKERIMTGCTDTAIAVDTVSGVREIGVERLIEELVVVSPGQKIAYVTDIRASRENLTRFAGIARHADTLFIETYYLHERAGEAFDKGHLTARQAGLIARELQARTVIPMHVSPRYHDRMKLLERELLEAWKGR